MNIRRQIYELIGPFDLHEDNVWSNAYHGVMFVAILVSITPLMFRAKYEIFWYFDVIPAILFIIDYILRWITADYDLKKGKASFFIYPFTFMAIVDLLSILPTIHLLSPTFKTARIPRLLKVLRVIKFIRYFEPLETITSVIKKQRKMLWTVVSLSLLYIFITALIMFNAEEEINPATGTYLFPTFFDAFYWAACTLTTVGYGDIYPISHIGRFISMISALVGIAIIALPSGIITAGYLDELKLRREQKEKERERRKNLKEKNSTTIINETDEID